MLRSYQQECVDKVIAHIKSSIEPAVVDATVSFGKTRTIAAIAVKVRDMSNKKVLILCPSGNLADQNAKAIKDIKQPVSLFSASLRSKSVRHDIIVGTPQSIKNSLSRFGKEIAAIIIDEGEGLTSAVIKIVDRIRELNPNVRVIGFTGTPFRTGTGYVYRLNEDGSPVPDTQTVDPFYTKLIHRTSTKDLLELGYLTPMVIGTVGADGYETSAIKVDSKGRPNPTQVAQTFVGRGRKTAAIVEDIVRQAHNRAQVMVFAASEDHCREVLESMPVGYAAIVANGMPDNEGTIKRFKRGDIKCIINVNMLTVGADFPKVDVIALLRKTDSARLLQQILGRGIRLHPDTAAIVNSLDSAEERKAAIASGPKPNCLLLDYTDDTEKNHYPDGDLWNPQVKARIKGEGFEVECKCPVCDQPNTFAGRKNPDGYELDEHGYFLDLAGDQIQTDYGPIPGHHGRRCCNYHPAAGGKMERCSYMWTHKDCPCCGEPNDVTARRCTSCKAEIIDPNSVLRLEFKQLKKDPTRNQCDVVTEMEVSKTINRKGDPMWKIQWMTEHRSFLTYHFCTPDNQWKQNDLDKLMSATNGLKQKPKTIYYVKEKSGFYRALAFDREPDVLEVV